MARLLAIPGARVAFGGERLSGHAIPACYGAWQPTAVYVPLREMLASPENFAAATTEIFGPFQVRRGPSPRAVVATAAAASTTSANSPAMPPEPLGLPPTRGA